MGTTTVRPPIQAPSRSAMVCDNDKLPARGGITELTRGRVTCPSRKDAVRILSEVVANSVKMLDNTISELTRAREAACRGEALGWPNLGDVTACWLKYRLGVCIDDLSAWTGGTFKSRSVAEVIRRLVRPRNLIASNAITYVCEAACKTEKKKKTYAWVTVTRNGVCIRTPEPVIHLCPPFWAGEHARFREMTIIHEAMHLTHCAAGAEDTRPGASIGSPECLAQFVASTNGKELDPEFVGRCVSTSRCGAIPKECRLPVPVRKPGLPDWQPKRPTKR